MRTLARGTVEETGDHPDPDPGTAERVGEREPPAVEGRELRKVYARGAHQVVALNDVSSTIPQGEYVTVMGSSGCGKSTLLNLSGGMDLIQGGLMGANAHTGGSLTGLGLSLILEYVINKQSSGWTISYHPEVATFLMAEVKR